MKEFTLENKLDFLDAVLRRCDRLSNKYNDVIGCSMNCKVLTDAIKDDLVSVDIINNFEKHKGN